MIKYVYVSHTMYQLNPHHDQCTFEREFFKLFLFHFENLSDAPISVWTQYISTLPIKLVLRQSKFNNILELQFLELFKVNKNPTIGL